MTRRPDLDADLERLLEGDGGEFAAIYRRLPKAEPPRRLDRAVLGEAARAVRGQTPRKHRWLLGLGSAAGLVLAAGLAWRIGHEFGKHSGDSPVPTAPTAAPSRPRHDVVPVQTIQPVAKPADAAAPTADAMPSASTVAPSPAARSHRAESAIPAKDARRSTASSARKPEAESALAAPPPPPPGPPATAASRPEVDRAETQPFEAGEAERAATAGGRLSSDAAPDRIREKARTRSALPTSSAPAPTGSMELRRDLQLPPADWLERIRDLKEQGRLQQAGESLRLFQRAHPRHDIPADLRELLD